MQDVTDSLEALKPLKKGRIKDRIVSKPHMATITQSLLQRATTDVDEVGSVKSSHYYGRTTVHHEPALSLSLGH